MRILITGASSGLGETLARHYAAPENELILLARREDKLQKVKTECEANGAKVQAVIADVNDFESLRKIGVELSKAKIDRIILNAGVSVGHHRGITPFEDFESLFKTNFLSLHALLENLLPGMMEQNKGEIVFISSLASLLSMPTSVAYSTSKRAMNAYAEGLRYQLMGTGVNVINILPGFIDSEMTQKNQFKMPFFLTTEEGVKRIIKAIEKKKHFYPFPLRFYLIIKIILLFPQFLRDRIVHFINFKKGH